MGAHRLHTALTYDVTLGLSDHVQLSIDEYRQKLYELIVSKKTHIRRIQHDGQYQQQQQQQRAKSRSYTDVKAAALQQANNTMHGVINKVRTHMHAHCMRARRTERTKACTRILNVAQPAWRRQWPKLNVVIPTLKRLAVGRRKRVCCTSDSHVSSTT
jgi:hypothetical protein